MKKYVCLGRTVESFGYEGSTIGRVRSFEPSFLKDHFYIKSISLGRGLCESDVCDLYDVDNFLYTDIENVSYTIEKNNKHYVVLKDGYVFRGHTYFNVYHDSDLDCILYEYHPSLNVGDVAFIRKECSLDFLKKGEMLQITQAFFNEAFNTITYCCGDDSYALTREILSYRKFAKDEFLYLKCVESPKSNTLALGKIYRAKIALYGDYIYEIFYESGQTKFIRKCDVSCFQQSSFEEYQEQYNKQFKLTQRQIEFKEKRQIHQSHEKNVRDWLNSKTYIELKSLDDLNWLYLALDQYDNIPSQNFSGVTKEWLKAEILEHSEIYLITYGTTMRAYTSLNEVEYAGFTGVQLADLL